MSGPAQSSGGWVSIQIEAHTGVVDSSQCRVELRTEHSLGSATFETAGGDVVIAALTLGVAICFLNRTSAVADPGGIYRPIIRFKSSARGSRAERRVCHQVTRSVQMVRREIRWRERMNVTASLGHSGERRGIN